MAPRDPEYVTVGSCKDQVGHIGDRLSSIEGDVCEIKRDLQKVEHEVMSLNKTVSLDQVKMDNRVSLLEHTLNSWRSGAGKIIMLLLAQFLIFVGKFVWDLQQKMTLDSTRAQYVELLSSIKEAVKESHSNLESTVTPTIEKAIGEELQQ